MVICFVVYVDFFGEVIVIGNVIVIVVFFISFFVGVYYNGEWLKFF